MAYDSASTTYEATVSYSHNRICQTFLTWNHSGRKRNVCSDHGVFADLNVLLIENGGLWKTDDAVLPKRSKSLSSRCAGTDGSMN
jgi:hypothetical protein